MKLLLDTNFLIYLVKYKLFHQLEDFPCKIFVLRSVLEELEKISSDKKKKLQDREAAKLAKKIIEEWIASKKAAFLETNKKADDAILGLAKSKKEWVIATMDKELKKKIKMLGNKTLIIRQKKIIMEE